MNINTTAEFIKKNRKRNKLTQPALAKKAGVGLRFMRELEAGKRTVRLDKVNKVLFIFGSVMAPVKLKTLMKK